MTGLTTGVTTMVPRATSWEQAARGVAKLNGITWERLEMSELESCATPAQDRTFPNY
jgi:hypothetical protein